MPLSPSDLAILSRLLDEALAVEPARREAWFAALPAQDAAYLPRLRVMLAQYEQSTAPSLEVSLPALPLHDAAELQPGERFGAYRVLERIGQGGMGAVWLAERADGAFERQVALKLPRLDGAALPPGLLAERMAREQQLLARLEHPHIARLYDAGVDDRGRPYLVMERVQGTHLLAHARTRGLDLRRRLALLRQVCGAVSHAHRHLIVHRDIKPSNILVDDAGHVKLLDFGIAKLLDVDGHGAVLSTQGQDALRAHTPRYAAPEQVSGAIVGTASDVYSLGVVMQELIDGVPPTPLRAESAAIARRATAVRPEDRYASVDQLSDDIERALATLPLRGVASSRRHRAALLLRRQALPLGAGAALALVVTALGAVAASQYLEARASEAESRAAQAFWLQTLQELEPAQGQPPDQLTALQILDGALANAQRQFDQQPAVLGQVLTHVGIMYQRLGQADRARRTAEQTVQRLQAALPEGHPVLQSARGQWAQRLSQAGLEPARARALAQQVLGPCGPDATLCARARTYAHSALRSLAAASGDSAAALVHARAAVAEGERGWPTPNPESVVSLSYLAVALRNRGELVEADAVMQRAVRIAAPLTLRARSEQELRLLQALIDADMGRLDEAAARFDALHGRSPDAGQRRLLRRLQGQVLLMQGLLREGLAAADEALDPSDAGRDALQLAFAHQLRARLAAALGDHAAAARDLAQAQAGLAAAGLPEGSLERMRARRVAAELDLRAGRVADALRALQALHAAERAAQPPPSAVESAQTLELLGCALRLGGDPSGAAQQHAQAAQALRDLPEAHPLRLRNALYAAWARPAPLAAADPAALERATERLRARLPPRSHWHAALASSATDPSTVVF